MCQKTIKEELIEEVLFNFRLGKIRWCSPDEGNTILAGYGYRTPPPTKSSCMWIRPTILLQFKKMKFKNKFHHKVTKFYILLCWNRKCNRFQYLFIGTIQNMLCLPIRKPALVKFIIWPSIAPTLNSFEKSIIK